MRFNDKINEIIKQRDSQDFQLEQQEKNVSDEALELFSPSPFFGVENVRNSPACLELRLSNGGSLAFPYAYIVEINYHPSDGIEMLTTSKKIKITGRNLKQLYLFLVGFRVKYIEANVGNDLTQEDKLFVKGIQIKETQ